MSQKVTRAVMVEAATRFYSKWTYRRCEYTQFNYNALKHIIWDRRPGRGDNITYNDCEIMIDTETSKKRSGQANHVVIWTLTIRTLTYNIVTLYGRKPSQLTDCISRICSALRGDMTIMYIHNLSYDWVFIRKFFIREFGPPDRLLATKPHYPIQITWDEGLQLRDSLILAQRNLEKWAKDLNVDHKKAVGSWDYGKLRDQDTPLSEDELTYAEYDTLAGVECIDATRRSLGRKIYNIPLTATGVPREDVRRIGKKNRAREHFKKMALSYDQYRQAELTYHGGYVHANRHCVGHVYAATGYDFASSYPYEMLCSKVPMERFSAMPACSPEVILQQSDDTAWMFKLVLIRPRMKSKHHPMPALQLSKCQQAVNPVTDNGRILAAEYVSIYLTEHDLWVINDLYDWDQAVCTDVLAARKGYLPRWFRDYVYACFTAKCELKGGDPVLYSIAKAKVNSLYGLMVQKAVKEMLIEDYESGEYLVKPDDPAELYQKYLDNNNTILPYQWGIWITAGAFRHLYELGACVAADGLWLYSDTDSAYGTKWDVAKLAALNQRAMDKLLTAGYDAVRVNGQEFWVGIADPCGHYSQFTALHAKCYVKRDAETCDLGITIAGVPKTTGALCLLDDINNFKVNFIFPGVITGKLTHTHIFEDDIYIDDHGNETGDSIDLTPCDYRIKPAKEIDWEWLETEEVEVIVYE